MVEDARREFKIDVHMIDEIGLQFKYFVSKRSENTMIPDLEGMGEPRYERGMTDWNPLFVSGSVDIVKHEGSFFRNFDDLGGICDAIICDLFHYQRVVNKEGSRVIYQFIRCENGLQREK